MGTHTLSTSISNSLFFFVNIQYEPSKHLSSPSCLSTCVQGALDRLSSTDSQQKVQDWDFDKFPIDLKKYKPIPLDPVKDKKLSAEQKETLVRSSCRWCSLITRSSPTSPSCAMSSSSSRLPDLPAAPRDTLGGCGAQNQRLRSRGAFDTVPEVVILLSFIAGDKDGSKFVDILFDEAGHRVATQYLLAVLDGHLPPEHLLHYREANSKLPGHPELGLTPGVKFSSGRLGHMWPLVNGVAMGNKGKTVFCLGSDGSQQEGDDAEAARLAAAQGLNVKLFIDDNDVTIA
jgi:hypothetical protein